MAGAASHHAAPRTAAALRTCVVCRQTGPATALVRLRSVTAAAASPLGGRSGYVCIAASCLAQLLRKNAAVNPPLGDLCKKAQTHLLDLLGLARRSGTLVHGIERVGELPRDGQATVMVATDLQGRAAARLARHPAVAPAAVLGHAAGLPGAGAVAIMGGRLSLQAAYWLRVWYETRVVEKRGVAR